MAKAARRRTRTHRSDAADFAGFARGYLRKRRSRPHAAQAMTSADPRAPPRAGRRAVTGWAAAAGAKTTRRSRVHRGGGGSEGTSLPRTRRKGGSSAGHRPTGPPIDQGAINRQMTLQGTHPLDCETDLQQKAETKPRFISLTILGSQVHGRFQLHYTAMASMAASSSVSSGRGADAVEG